MNEIVAGNDLERCKSQWRMSIQFYKPQSFLVTVKVDTLAPVLSA